MSGIGEYVHYKKKNYIRYGTGYPENKSEKSRYGQAMEVFANSRQQILSQIHKSDNTNSYESIEKFLNDLMYGSPQNSGIGSQVFQQFQNEVLEEFQKTYPYLGIDFNNGLSVYNEFGQTPPENTTLSTLKGYVEKINKLLQNNQIASKNIEEIKQLQLDIDNYVQMCLQQGQGLNSTINLNNSSNIIDRINLAFHVGSKPSSQAIKKVFNIWLAIANKLTATNANKTAQELLANNLIKPLSSHISMKNFSQDIVSNESIQGVLPKGWNYISSAASFQFQSTSQDRLGVIFNYDNDVFQISSANYSLGSTNKQIYLIQGIPLMNLISNMGQIDFVNHWLNCISTGEGAVETNRIQQAHILMKLSIFATALNNYKGVGGSADTFILNNRAERRIYVRSIQDMAYQMSQIFMETNGENKMVSISNYPKTINNIWVGDMDYKSRSLAQQRISNLINSLHGYSLSVSINPNLLNFNKK